ncbi:MAG: MopE-related protein, partial [Desulfobacterales bacterium]
MEDDTVEESGEGFSLDISSVSATSGTAIEGDPSTAAYEIIDNDTSVSVSVSPGSGPESVDPVFTFLLSNPVPDGEVVTVDYAVAYSGGATAADLSVVPPGSVTITGPATSADVTVQVEDDKLIEKNEDVTIEITAVSKTDGTAVTGAQNSATYTIDSDDIAFLSIQGPVGGTISEASGHAVFTVILNDGGAGLTLQDGISFNYWTMPDSTSPATDGQDYIGTNESPVATVISAGQNSVDIEVPIQDDLLVEPDNQTFHVWLGDPLDPTMEVETSVSDVKIPGNTNASCTIISDDVSTLRITGPANPVTEGDDAVFSVHLDHQIEDGYAVTLQHETSSPPDGTATPVVDFSPVATPDNDVPIPTSVDSFTIPVSTVLDSIIEDPEIFLLYLLGTSSDDVVVSGVPGEEQASASIRDDTRDTIRIDTASVPVRFNEYDGTLSIPLVITGGALIEGTSVEVSYQVSGTVEGSDYTLVDGGGFTIDDSNYADPQIEIELINDSEIERTDSLDDGGTPYLGENLVITLVGSNSPLLTIDDVDNSADILIVDNDYEVSFETTENGTVVSPSGPVTVNHDGSVDIDYSWDYEFQTFTVWDVTNGEAATIPGDVGSVDSSTLGILRLSNFGTDVRVRLIFKHQLELIVGENGKVEYESPGSGTYTSSTSPAYLIVDHDESEDGAGPTFNFNPNQSADIWYCVRDVLEGGVSQGAVEGHVVDTMTANNTLEVYFRDGSVTVLIEPAAVASAVNPGLRGQWKIVDSNDNDITTDWLDGDNSHPLPCNVNDYKIVFKEVPGWITPDPIPLTIDATTTENPVYTGTYISRTYVLTVQTAGDGSGSINMDPEGSGLAGPGTYTYFYGDSVNLSAISESGSGFLRWEGAASGTSSPVTITMDQDKTVTAVFFAMGTDADGDGFLSDDPDPARRDCDDNNPAIHPDAQELCGNTVDENCDGVAEECGPDHIDNDGDGYSEVQGDCNDSDASIYPGAEDVCDDGIDQDCYDGDRICGSQVTCVTPSEIPLESQAITARPAIMFLLDDSGSMDWEFMTPGSQGLFEGTYYYIFDDEGDNNYPQSSWYYDQDYLRHDSNRVRDYRTRWAGYNRIFYNPVNKYNPWPRWNVLPNTDGSSGSLSFDANPDTPRSNPVKSTPTHDLDENYFTVRVVTSSETGPDQSIVLRRVAGANGTTIADAIWLKSSSLPDVVLDDEDAGFLTSGTWMSGVNVTADYNASVHATLTEGASAKWNLNIPATGDYEVLVFNPPYNQADMNAEYTIHHTTAAGSADSSVSYPINQRIDNDPLGSWWSSNYWTTLGTYHFNSNTPTTQNYNIHLSHYFVKNGSTIYLVNLNGQAASGQFQIFRFDDADSDNRVDDDELSLVFEGASLGSVADTHEIYPIIPRNADGSVRSYAQERQNFANWFSFFRKRQFAAKAAVGQVIEDMSDARIGFDTINNPYPYTAQTEMLNIDLSTGEDETSDLLNILYSRVKANGSTPLKKGLENIGKYFNQDSSDPGEPSNGGISTTRPVWDTEANGGGCQRAFTIAMTDGFWNTNNEPSVGNADGDDNTDYDGGEYGSNNHTNTLADVAMYYFEQDLHPGLPDSVKPKGQDLAPHQHMTTYGVSFGLYGTINPSSYPNCPPRCEAGELDCPDIDCPDWPQPQADSQTTVDDLWHAAVNGRGLFLSAGDPIELVNALITVMQDIQDMTATGASVAINAQELQSSTLLFQAIYKTNEWTGDLLAKPLDPDTGAIRKITNSEGKLVDEVLWSAADRLEAGGWGSRRIITFNGTVGIPFNSTYLSSDQMTLLGDDAAEQENMIEYIRGNGALEGTLYRERPAMLGDIVHSSPVHVKLDTLPLDDPNHEPGLVVVGANDGMVHVFKEDTGDEIFAYIPKLVLGNLKDLSVPLYSH